MAAKFLITDSCPNDSKEWRNRERQFNCSYPKEVYHCLEDNHRRLGETCIEAPPPWVEKSHCPEYNYDVNKLTTVTCNMSARCPDVPFKSNEVYRFPVCIEGISSVDADESPTWEIIILCVVALVLIIFLVITIICYRKRREKQTTERNDEQILLLSKEIPFYKTSTFHEANNFLRNGGKILCLIGQWGSGKSTTAKQVYMSLTGKTPIVIEDILKFDVSSCHESVIVEEPIPGGDVSDIEKSNVVERVISLCKQIQKTNNTFLIITSTDEAWKSIAGEVNNCEFKKNELRCIDLNCEKLTNGERTQILHTIFQYYNPDTPFPTKFETVLSKFNNNNIGFPEICTLFFKCSEFQKHGVIFFNRPLRYLCEHFEEMCKSSNEKDKFLLLVYMSVNNMKIDMNKSNDKLWEIFRSGGLNTDRVSLKSILPNKFIVEKESSVYVLQHDIIKRMTLITFGKFYFSELLRFSSRRDLVGLIKHKKKTFLTPLVEGSKSAADREPFLEINDEQWYEYQAVMGMTNQAELESK